MLFGLIQDKLQNEEEARIKEASKVADITMSAKDISNIYEFLAKWNEFVKIAQKSNFQEIYDTKTFALEKIYDKFSQSAKNLEDLDSLLDNPSNGYKSISDLTSVFLTPEEIKNDYIQRKGNDVTSRINDTVNKLKKDIEIGHYRFNDLTLLGGQIDELSALCSDFGIDPKNAITNKEKLSEFYELGASYGRNLLEAMIFQESPRILASNRGLQNVGSLKAIIENYAEKTGNAHISEENAEEIKILEEKLNSKVSKFARRYINKKQDQLYEIALEFAQDPTKYCADSPSIITMQPEPDKKASKYEDALYEFIKFSSTYGQVLEEDSQSLGKAVEQIENAYKLAFYNEHNPNKKISHTPNKRTTMAKEGKKLSEATSQFNQGVVLKYILIK